MNVKQPTTTRNENAVPARNIGRSATNFLKTGQTGGGTSLISGSKARSEFEAFSKKAPDSRLDEPGFRNARSWPEFVNSYFISIKL